MVLGNRFQSQPKAIATYNYTDVATGIGVVLYYVIGTRTGASTYAYSLTTDSAAYASQQEVLHTGAAGTSTTYNFDLTPFNTPQVAKGTALFNCCLAAQNNYGYIIAQLFHWDGTTETSITSAVQTSNSAAHLRECLELPITQKQFKVGEILRLKVIIHKEGTTGVYAMGCDPTGIFGGWLHAALTAPVVTTTSILHMPFLLDL